MHIAMFIGSLSKGGSERVTVNLADYFIRNGHQVTVVTQYQKKNEYPFNPKAKRVLSDITPAETGGSRMVNFYRRLRKLRNIWKNEKPDVILSFIGKNNMMAILTTRFLPVSVAVAVRGAPMAEYPSRRMRRLARWLYRYADGVILQTESSLAFFPEAVRRKGVILKNPMERAFFRSRFQGERDKTIIAVGRVDENKNHRLLMEAFSRIATEFPEYRVIIYGEGDLRETLQQEAEKRGLAERILLPGNSDEIAEKLYRGGIYVLTSDTEGSPNTLIEAMLLGLAVIATDCPCGGPARLIEPGKNGLLIPVGDVASLTNSLRYLLADLSRADAMGKEAACLQASFDPDQTGQTWENYLQSLILSRL